MLEVKTISQKEFTKMRTCARQATHVTSNDTPIQKDVSKKNGKLPKMVLAHIGAREERDTPKKKIIVHTKTLEAFKKEFPIKYMITLPVSQKNHIARLSNFRVK